MSELLTLEALLTPEEYLEAELSAQVKHEYLGGHVYAMAGAGWTHNLITSNLHTALGQHLAGSPCVVVGSDMLLRAAVDVFYYPDLMVCCDPTDRVEHYAQRPRYVLEIASPSTRRIDEGEKALAYWRVPSIEAYVLVEQDIVRVRVLRRREGGWETEVLTDLDDLLRLDPLGFAAPLRAVYARTQVGRVAE